MLWFKLTAPNSPSSATKSMHLTFPLTIKTLGYRLLPHFKRLESGVENVVMKLMKLSRKLQVLGVKTSNKLIYLMKICDLSH